MTLPGIDISDYQLVTPNLAGLAFCIVKASEGMKPASRYPAHIANIRKAGIVTGAYHFARKDSGTPAQQATHFLSVAGNVDLYAVDVEGPYAFSLAQSQAFVDAMHKAGKQVGMYGSLSGFQHAGQDWDWVAFYNPTPPPIHYDFWQYGPRIIGSAKIDGDVYNGTAADLERLIGGTDMAFAGDPHHKLIDLASGAPIFDDAGVTPLAKTTAALTGVESPGAVKGKPNLRLFWRSYQAGVWQLVSAAPTKVYDAPSGPVLVPTPLGPGIYEVK